MKLTSNLCFILLFFCSCCFAQPVLNSFTPTSGPSNSSVTITGSGFSVNPSSNIVFFGAVRATVSSASPTSITVSVPTGATEQPISVTSNGLTGYSRNSFRLTFPGSMPLTQNPDGTQSMFSPKIDFTTDLHPNGIVVADFDGDKKADIATANNFSVTGSPASVTILHNTGVNSINFAQGINLSTGVQAYALATGDLNGDGRLDLASVSIADQSLSIFANSSVVGTISFAPKVNFPTGNSPYSVVIAEIDGDGRPDIAVANNTSNTISIYRNISNGTTIAFATRIDITTSLGPHSLAMGDIDGDGKSDIAVANEFSNTISIFRNMSNTGTISFATRSDYTVGNKPLGIAIGDLNDDGLLDLISVNNSSNTYSVFKNQSTSGSVILANRVDGNTGINPTSVTLSDLTGDGKSDILISAIALSVHQNNSSGTILTIGSPAYLETSPFQTAVGDLDGDGKKDIACGIFTSDKVSVLRNKINEPSIRFFSPTTAAAGTNVTISGVNLSGVTGIRFGNVPATTMTVVNNNTVTATVGSGASGFVTASNIYGGDSMSGFVFAGPPVISSYTPASAGPNQMVTLTGQNFSNASAVSFGGTPATSYNILSPNTITAALGSGASGNITVTSPFGTGSAGGFNYIPTPTISSFTPVTAASGQTVTITGTNFTGTTAVSFGGVNAFSFTVVSSTTLTALVGTGATGAISVTNAFGTASNNGFTYIPLPQITSFSPAIAGTSATVTITGLNFLNASSVSFGGQSANSFSVNTTGNSISAVVGSGASGVITVVTPGGTVSSPGFNFIPPPLVTSFSPLTATPGNTIVISGTNFGALPSDNTVTIGGLVTPVTEASPTSLKISVPEMAVNRKISVSTRNLTSVSSYPFQTLHPAIQNSFTSSSFDPRVNAKGAIGPFNIISTDIDGDKKMDIISGSTYMTPIAILRNTSSTTSLSFAPKIELTSLSLPYYISAGDIDGDGKPDIIATDYTGIRHFCIFRNTSQPGAISFASRIDWLAGTQDVGMTALGDVDGDGRVDVVARIGAASIAVFLNLSTPGFINFASPVIYAFDSNALLEQSLVIEDMDGDSKPDIIASGKSIVVLKNLSTPGRINLATPISIGSNTFPNYITVNDLDGDGKKEIVDLENTLSVTVYHNQSNVSTFNFTPTIFYTASFNVYGVQTGDLDGNGKPELVVIENGAPTSFSIFNNISTNGNFALSPRVSFPYIQVPNQTYTALEIMDLDADNSQDLIIGMRFSDSTFIFRNKTAYNSVSPICEGGNTSFTSHAVGSSYQWQVNNGSGFINLLNNANYSGINSQVLQLNNIPLAFSGNIYRCSVNGTPGTFFQLSVSPTLLPSLSISSNGCSSSAIQLTAVAQNAGNNAIIEWYVNNQLSGTGPTYTLNNPVNGMNVYAKLKVSATCANPQTTTSSPIIINCITTGLTLLPDGDYFDLLPNPSKGLFVAKLRNSTRKNVGLLVYDATGKTVYQTKTESRMGDIEIPIDLRGHADGVYYLHINLGKQAFISKLVILK